MLGDPGTAKSQLLKFVEKCSPIGVGGLRCLVVVRLILSSCPLHSTKDQTVVTADTCPCIHSWAGWQRCELPLLVLTWKRWGGCRTGHEGERGKQVMPFVGIGPRLFADVQRHDWCCCLLLRLDQWRGWLVRTNEVDCVSGTDLQAEPRHEIIFSAVFSCSLY